MYPSRTSPELALGTENILKLLNNLSLHFLQLLTARHIASLLQFFHFVLGDSKPNVEERFLKKLALLMQNCLKQSNSKLFMTAVS
jgi:hypothetical protein